MGNKTSKGHGGGAGAGAGAAGSSGRSARDLRATPARRRSGPALDPELATAGRDLFRRFASHLDHQTERAPHLGTPARSPDMPPDEVTYGTSPEAEEFVRQYHWVEAVGAGSYSTVHRVRDKATGRPLAVKCIRKELLNSDVRRQIEAEAALMLECRGHENVVELLAFKNFGSEYYFVMEFCPSTVLRTVVLENKTASYSEAIAASIIRQTAAALAHLHSLGIIHLDVKPDNLLLSSSCSPAESVGVGWFPQMKLADFGMAARSPVRRTVGTLFYVAPEILTEGWAETSADMWSLGVVLYVLLCGFPPFMPPADPSGTPIETQVIRGAYKFYSPYWDSVSDHAKDLVRRLLRMDPDSRLTAKEVLRHPWLRTASPAPLPADVTGRLGRLSARSKFQRGVRKVQAAIALGKHK